MTDIVLSNELNVELIQALASDDFVAQTARVSTANDLELQEEGKTKGLVNYLLKKRHGSPFEHNIFTFRINAPIFVAREAFRHRIASYNEVSGRYTKLEAKFYIYPETRPLVQKGSSAHPDIQHGEDLGMHQRGNGELALGYQQTWDVYENLLAEGWALEAARAILPVGIYTSWYVSMNARALMNFLSLRVDAEGNMFETKPQWEIQQVAQQMDTYFKIVMPLTHEAFESNGRVAP